MEYGQEKGKFFVKEKELLGVLRLYDGKKGKQGSLALGELLIQR